MEKKEIKYDLEFIFAEVSADVNYWLEGDDGSYKITKVQHDTVGKSISTKSVGNNNRHDITLEYKYPEGSIAERAAFTGESNDENLKSSIEIKDNVNLGEPVVVKVSVQRNKKINSPLHADIQLIVNAVSYAGRRPPKLVKQDKATLEVPLDENQAVSLTMKIKPEEYTSLLQEDIHFDIKAFVIIQETKQTSILEKEFNFVNQPIIIDYLGTLVGLHVGTKGKVKVTYTNPLQISLTEVVLRVEGQSLTEVQTFKIGTIPSGKTINQIVEIEALENQNHFLIATLNSKELSGITGHLDLFVY